MTVPSEFVGAWEREGLDVGGAVVHGVGRALWIESGGTYVDVRAPGTVASGTSFGGRSTWHQPVFTCGVAFPTRMPSLRLLDTHAVWRSGSAITPD